MSDQATRIARNTLANYVRMALSVGISLAITRYTLNALSKDFGLMSAQTAFGTFSLVISLAAFTAFIQDAGTKVFVRRLVQTKETEIHRVAYVFSSGWVIGLLIGIIRAAVLSLIAIPLIKTFKLPTELEIPSHVVLWILVFFQLFDGVFKAWGVLLVARELFTLQYTLTLSGQILRLILILNAQHLPGGVFVGLGLALTIPDVCVALGITIYLFARDPFSRLDLKKIELKEIKELFTYIRWNLLFEASWNLFFRADQIVCTALLGPAANAIYAIADQIYNQVANFSGLVNGVILPAASKAAILNDKKNLANLYVHATRISLALAFGVGAFLSVFGNIAIDIWLGKGHNEVAKALPYVMAILVVRLPVNTSWNVLMAVGNMKQPAVAQFLEGLINQLLSIIFIMSFHLGLPGIYLGTLAAALPRYIILHLNFLSKILGRDPMYLLKDSLAQPWIGGITLLLILLIMKKLLLINTGLAFIAVLISILGCYIYWVWDQVLSQNGRNAMRRIFGIH
jgi:O-antigen/teichoic acid export membrane protein